MNRRRSNSLAGNPLLIGAITTLIIVVAVYLAYNANNGLPFVPTYNISVELPEASGLIPSNQVRVGGTRVGIVESLSPRQNPRTGRVTAIAHLKLEKDIEPLPVDTRAVVQSVSAIGLKYLELEKGNSKQGLKAGATIPVSQAREAVSIDELFNMFDQPTRTAIKQNTNNFGDGLAGRGLGLNQTIAELRPLVNKAIPVLHNLALPSTGFGELFKALDRVASQSAPVAQAQANYYVDLDNFFSEFARVYKSLEAATQGGPASLQQATYSLPYEAPLIEKATEFMRLLHPSATSLKTVAPSLAHAFKEGAANLGRAESLSEGTAEAAQALASFSRNPLITEAFESFTNTTTIGNPLLAGLAPEQENCNYITLAFRNIASVESESIGVGTVARAGVVLAPPGGNSPGFPSAGVADGPSTEREKVFVKGAVGKIIDSDHLHANPYPSVTAPGQAQVCEAGNETYIPGKATIGRLPASDVTSAREITGRENDLFGEKYSSTQLKNLGLVKPAAKKAPAKKSGGKK